MPELPEVETMKNLLLPFSNKIINKVVVNNRKLRLPINSSFEEDIENSSFHSIKRKGKYLIFCLSNGKHLIMHAGMSGKFVLSSENIINKHDHIVFHLPDVLIKFNDPRRFGIAITTNLETDINTHSIFNNIGKDALLDDVNALYLQEKFKSLKTDIKTALLNQSILAGIGNIYASEILYYSNIHPLTNASDLSISNLENILYHTKKILNKSIELGGSTLKDYQKPNGETGYFQNTFAVYNKENQKCPNCNCNKNIKKIIQKGRSTYFCENKQQLISKNVKNKM